MAWLSLDVGDNDRRGSGGTWSPRWVRFAQEREYLVLARVLLAQGRPGQALTLLGRVLAQAATGGRIGVLSRYARCKP